MDHPPFVPALAWLFTSVFGVNSFAFRLPLALALGTSCALTGWLARRMGAGTFGELLASLAFACSPIFLRLGAFLNIPCFEVLFWLVVAHLLVSIEQRGAPRGWLWVGVVAGISLLNKHTMLFLGVGLAVGILLTRRRRDLVTPWPWLGGALAALVFSPNLVWQVQHDWATLEFVRNINATIMQSTPRAEFILAQVLLINPFNVFVCMAGLWFCLVSGAGVRFRMLGWIFITVAGIMLVLKAKVYYLAPAYPMLLAAGAAYLTAKPARAWIQSLRMAHAVSIAAMGIVLAPIFTPIGSIEWKEDYISRVLGFMFDDPTDLTFDFRNQTVRNEELHALADVSKGLSGADRRDCAVLTAEYDGASAVNVSGREMGLPEGISGNNSYYLWGPGTATGSCVLAIDFDEDFLRKHFGEVVVSGYAPTRRKNALPTDRPIFVCRHPNTPLATMWPDFKTFH